MFYERWTTYVKTHNDVVEGDVYKLRLKTVSFSDSRRLSAAFHIQQKQREKNVGGGNHEFPWTQKEYFNCFTTLNPLNSIASAIYYLLNRVLCLVFSRPETCMYDGNNCWGLRENLHCSSFTCWVQLTILFIVHFLYKYDWGLLRHDEHLEKVWNVHRRKTYDSCSCRF